MKMNPSPDRGGLAPLESEALVSSHFDRDEGGKQPRIAFPTGDPALDQKIRRAVLRRRLTNADLQPCGLKAFRMNMLSLFGEMWPRAKIEAAAREAAINKLWFASDFYRHYVREVAAARPRELQLKGFPVDRIKEALAWGRGLIIVTFHFGHYRYIGSDLAVAGIPVCLLFDRVSFVDFESARRASPSEMWSHITPVNAEELRAGFTLAKALSKGGCVHAMIDGNTGLDGARGNDHRQLVQVLGCPIRVKVGLIKMAAKLGAPLLPIVAPTIDGEKRCITDAIIDPAKALAGEAAERFVELAAHELYSQYARHLVAYPEEWAGGDRFHMWRKPEHATDLSVSDAQRALETALESGGTVGLNDRRVTVELSHDDDRVWADVKTLRCYRFPKDMCELADQLVDGVDVAWLGRYEEPRRTHMWSLLIQLAARGVIMPAAGRSRV